MHRTKCPMEPPPLPETRQGTLHLRYAVGNAMFIIWLGTISKYSAISEPVTQMLTAVNTGLLGVKKHIATFVKCFKDHRECANVIFMNDVMPWVKSVARVWIRFNYATTMCSSNIQGKCWRNIGGILLPHSLHSILGLPDPIPWQSLRRTKFTIF